MEPRCNCGDAGPGHKLGCPVVRGYVGSQAALNTPENQRACDALESLLRALARPTMGERFAAFEARVRELLEPYATLRLAFDCDANGPVCRVKHPLFAELYGKDDERTRRGYSFHESAHLDEAVQQAVRGWAEFLGRAALRGDSR